MQILKANTMKSVTVSHLLHSSDSICIIYDDYCPPLYGAIHLDSTRHSIDDLKELIKDEINNLTNRKDYLIIYTNKTEQEIEEIVDFMNQLKAVVFREVLITCRR